MLSSEPGTQPLCRNDEGLAVAEAAAIILTADRRRERRGAAAWEGVAVMSALGSAWREAPRPPQDCFSLE